MPRSVNQKDSASSAPCVLGTNEREKTKIYFLDSNKTWLPKSVFGAQNRRGTIMRRYELSKRK